MVNTYKLVNPHITGEFKNSVKARNSVEAAKILYNNMSEHFNNNLPEFYFTIHKGRSGKGKHYHFHVKEKREGEEVSFSLQTHTIRNEKSALAKFNQKLNKYKGSKLTGGKKETKKTSKKSKKTKKVELDDSDSSEDYYRRAKSYVPINNYPIYSWWYDPYLYRLDSIYVPTFYNYVTPYIQIPL